MLAPTLPTSRLALASLSVAASLALLACERPAVGPSAAPDEPPTDEVEEAAPGSLAWTLTVEPSTFTFAEIDEVRLHIEVRNTGTATVKPLHPWDFRVDGEPSMALSLAFGNGVRPQNWQALPPGESAVDERIGVAFVDATGEHVVSVHDGDLELARVVIHVEER
jgi:hypothetical protein